MITQNSTSLHDALQPSGGQPSIEALVGSATNFAVVTFVVLGVLWALRAWSRRGTQRSGGKRIRTLDSALLGRGCSVHLLDVDGVRILVGSSEGGLTSLGSLAPAGEPSVREGGVNEGSFHDSYERLLDERVSA